MNKLASRPSNRPSDRELTSALTNCLNSRYDQVLHAAALTWEKCFAGKDASDACVSVRISGRTLNHAPRSFRRRLGYGL